MIVIPPVGSTILVTFPTKPYNRTLTMKVIADDIKDDSFGTIKLQVLKDVVVTSHIEHDGEFFKKPSIHSSTIKTQWRQFYNEDGSKKIKEIFNTTYHPCVDRYSIVEEQWFDEELTGRKVTIIN